MVSAGIDTIPGNLVMGLAYLACEDGQRIQAKAYEEIMKVYPDNDAWEKCLLEEKVPYITALVKEILRFWTVIPICLPRKSIKDVTWEGVTIPANTTFFMVSLKSLQPSPVYNRCIDNNPNHRTPGQQTTTQPILRSPRNSFQNVTSTPRKQIKAHLTTVMELDHVCVPDHTWPTGSSTRLLFDW